MSTIYFIIPKVDLDAQAGETDFDTAGIHDCCNEYGNYSTIRKSPVPDLDLGAVTQVVLKCDDIHDLTDYYPGAVEKTWAETLAILGNADNHYFKLPEEL